MMFMFTELCVADTPPFSLLIRAENYNVRRGESVILDITLTNTSEKPLTMRTPLNSYYGDENYRLDVSKSNGNAVEKTYATPKPENKRDAQLWALSHRTFGSMRLEQINPGDTEKEKINLSQRYDLSSPGTYLVRVARDVEPGNDTGVVVLSNLIRVTVAQ